MRVNEIFSSINGEVCEVHQGSLCTFIRLSGCNLKCTYCDTVYAQDPKSGKEMSIEKIVSEAKRLGNSNITITGGEPLQQQEELRQLINCLSVYEISIETNGSILIPEWFEVSWVADFKTKSSGMAKHMNLDNYKNLSSTDFLKFVISNKTDFDQALLVVQELRKQNIFVTPAFSPKFTTKKTKPIPLQKWMQEDTILKRAGAILNIQLHKWLGVK